AVGFGASAAAEETLASLGTQAQISKAIVRNGPMQHFAAWRHEPLANKEQVSGLISKWLFPGPTVQPNWHQGTQIGELRLTALDELISHFLGISILGLTGSILPASFI
ncbi:GGDEF domain-containing protein, partial [Klebsiella pneumoniae]|uniref:CHASE sensor domain-containing protein n=1 Tax=Klebsiella pneumoniae TaxID=573 RepID=UPI001025A769